MDTTMAFAEPLVTAVVTQPLLHVLVKLGLVHCAVACLAIMTKTPTALYKIYQRHEELLRYDRLSPALQIWWRLTKPLPGTSRTRLYLYAVITILITVVTVLGLLMCLAALPFLPTDVRPFFYNPRPGTSTAPELSEPRVYDDRQLRKRRRAEEDDEPATESEVIDLEDSDDAELQCHFNADYVAQMLRRPRKVRVTPQLRERHNARRLRVSNIGDHIAPWVAECLTNVGRVLAVPLERLEDWWMAGRHEQLATKTAELGRYCRHVSEAGHQEDGERRIRERFKHPVVKEVPDEAPEDELPGSEQKRRGKYQPRVDDDDNNDLYVRDINVDYVRRKLLSALFPPPPPELEDESTTKKPAESVVVERTPDVEVETVDKGKGVAANDEDRNSQEERLNMPWETRKNNNEGKRGHSDSSSDSDDQRLPPAPDAGILPKHLIPGRVPKTKGARTTTRRRLTNRASTRTVQTSMRKFSNPYLLQAPLVPKSSTATSSHKPTKTSTLFKNIIMELKGMSPSTRYPNPAIRSPATGPRRPSTPARPAPVIQPVQVPVGPEETGSAINVPLLKPLPGILKPFAKLGVEYKSQPAMKAKVEFSTPENSPPDSTAQQPLHSSSALIVGRSVLYTKPDLHASQGSDLSPTLRFGIGMQNSAPYQLAGQSTNPFATLPRPVPKSLKPLKPYPKLFSVPLTPLAWSKPPTKSLAILESNRLRNNQFNQSEPLRLN
ncbi:hypothetical protein CC86DRAFT_418853 [Ophiobolus disseminans]|uniref:Uncharacterized protein n=1 Tax=Ophiobolus disseminans TaxID=1469910 RepID=A0A6A6ZXQ3_9PLEO|nr:hypothetical protein CC86DRAFT_418853 [Ophiobolus disseminans]